MLKKILFITVLISLCTGFAFSQEKPRLGVLPLYGGAEGEGETIANLFSNERTLRESFTVVLRTSAALDAIAQEHKFQLSGLTDSDTIAGIGREINAAYVLSGSIRTLGHSNFMIVTVIEVESFEQVAGYYLMYHNIVDVMSEIPRITTSLINTTLTRKSSKQNTLALRPFATLSGLNPQDAETLAQILAIDLLNNSNYAILPRTRTIQTAISELEYQTKGLTEEEGMAAIGRAVNAQFVLSGTISKVGEYSLFMAQILRVEDQSIIIGADKNYGDISDGRFLMEEIAILLTDPANAEARIALLNQMPDRTERRKFLADNADRLAREEKRRAQQAKNREAEAKRAERARKRGEAQEVLRDSRAYTWLENRAYMSKRNEVEQLSLFIGWVGGDDIWDTSAGSSYIPFLLPSGVYWSPVSFLSLGIETRFIHFKSDAFDPINEIRFASLTPAVGTVVSVFDQGKVFANFLIEIGNFGRPVKKIRDTMDSSYPGIGKKTIEDKKYLAGAITEAISPGLSAGFIFEPPGVLQDVLTFNVEYRCIILKNKKALHAIDFGVGVTYESVRWFFDWVGSVF